MIRLAHYPQNEYIVRLAEQMGLMLWEEIPVWQGIDFKDSSTRLKAQRMYTEMLLRDRNRCALTFGELPMKQLLPNLVMLFLKVSLNYVIRWIPLV